MNAFVRQIAVLSVLWALCELLMPGGKQQRMARLTVSILVMAAFLNALNGFLHMGKVEAAAAQSVWTGVELEARPEYGRIARRSLANQAQAYCQRMARRAGYEAAAVVWLREDGALERIDLTLKPGASPPLLSREELRRALAKALDIEESRICLNADDGADSS